MSTMQTQHARFTDEEWALVRHVPFDAFLLAALSDGELDPKEIEPFTDEIANAERLRNPLHREVASDIRAGHMPEELALQARESATDMTARIEKTKTMLQEKLPRDEYQDFIGSCFVTGLKVARAAGGHSGRFRHKDPVSDEEKAGLAAFAISYGLDPNALEQYQSR